MRLLIIEDDSIFVEILEHFFDKHGCDISVARTLTAARAQLNAAPFDFILLDNHLPDGEGPELLPFIKRLNYRVPVLIITAEDDQSVMSDAFDNGVDDFLTKPVNMSLLWKKIQRWRSSYDKENSLALQTERLERLLNKQEQEEQLARYVYEHVASTVVTDVEGIDTYLQSSSAFNGDFFISEKAPNGNRFVILADATGHGLAAAISVLPLVTTLRAMIRKGLSLAHIIHEANKKLYKELPDDKFVTLIGIEINFHSQYLDLFNGGMPPVLEIKQDRQILQHPAPSLALGIMAPEDFEPGIIQLALEPIRNLVFFSDGLIEQPNPLGELFGQERVIEIIEQHQGSEPLVSRLVNEFTVFNEMQELHDDLSLCDLQIPKLNEFHLYDNVNNDDKIGGEIHVDMTISGGLIGTSDIIGCLDSIMRHVDMVGDLRQRAFTVFAELISNGLDHGILDLDSKLKNDYAGFAEYLQLKEERLLNISENDKLGMKLAFNPSSNAITFEITDSGKGFDMQKVATMQDEALSGRGLALIDKLCEQVTVFAPGNKTLVNLKRDY